MKISYNFYLFGIFISFFLACSPEEEPSPVPSPAEVKALLNKNWDLHDFHLEANPDSALFYMKKVNELAKASSKFDWVASSYYGIAYIQVKQGYIGDAAYHFLKAAKMFEEAGELSNLANAYTSVGDIYAKAEDYTTAITYFQPAKDIFLYKGTSSDKAKIYRNLAICYKELTNYEEAEKALSFALKEAEEVEGYSLINLVYNVQGATKFEQQEYEEARKFYRLTLQHIDESVDDPYTKARAFNNIGETYLKEGEYFLAEELLNQALDIKKGIKDPTFIQSTLNLLGRLRIEQEQYGEAIRILDKGFSNIPTGTVDPAVEEGLALMMEALVKTNAKGTPAQYAQLNRQLATYSQKLMAYNTKLSDLKQQLETTSKQQALQLALEKHTLGNQLEAAEEKNKQIQYAFIIPVLLLIAASISIYLAVRRNRNAKQLINAIDDVLNKRHHNTAR